MLAQRWSTVYDARPTLTQHWFNILCSLGSKHEALIQCWVNVVDGGPTLIQHWVNLPCLLGYNQLTRYTDPMLFWCWPGVEDGGSTLKQNLVSASCLLEKTDQISGRPGNTRHWTNVGSVLAHRLRLWPIINTPLEKTFCLLTSFSSMIPYRYMAPF